MVSHKIIRPSNELQNYIHQFWFTEWKNNSVENSIYSSRADGFAKMIFAYRETDNETILPLFFSLHGQTEQSGQHPIPANGSFKIFGVSLFPYVVPLLFDLQISEMRGRMLRFENITNSTLKGFYESLLSARGTDELVTAFNAFFSQRLNLALPSDQLAIPVMKKMRMLNGNLNIAALASEFNLSHKQFERRFLSFTGFTPKLYARIVRFETVLNNYSATDSFTKTACTFGYYDQSHFNRDFKKFSGKNPTSYFAINRL